MVRPIRWVAVGLVNQIKTMIKANLTSAKDSPSKKMSAVIQRAAPKVSHLAALWALENGPGILMIPIVPTPKKNKPPAMNR